MRKRKISKVWRHRSQKCVSVREWLSASSGERLRDEGVTLTFRKAEMVGDLWQELFRWHGGSRSLSGVSWEELEVRRRRQETQASFITGTANLQIFEFLYSCRAGAESFFPSQWSVYLPNIHYMPGTVLGTVWVTKGNQEDPVHEKLTEQQKVWATYQDEGSDELLQEFKEVSFHL